jgi:hypothetical protein
MIEAKLQVVLSTLTKRNFQDAFKKGRSCRNGACTQKETASRMMVASRPKVSFGPDGSPSPEIMDGALYGLRKVELV